MIDGSSITKMGNTFNGANQLVQLNGSGALPTVNGALITSLPFITYVGPFGKAVPGGGLGGTNTTLEMGAGGASLGSTGSQIPLFSSATVMGICASGEQALTAGTLVFDIVINGTAQTGASNGELTVNTSSSNKQFICSTTGSLNLNVGDRIGLRVTSTSYTPANAVWAGYVITKNR
jgi:hypothetical protein